MTNRKRPAGSSGALAALMIAPRAFCYFVCVRGCMRSLYFTYAGETCPHCGAPVTADCFVEGEVVGAAGRVIDLRSRGPLTP